MKKKYIILAFLAGLILGSFIFTYAYDIFNNNDGTQTYGMQYRVTLTPQMKTLLTQLASSQNLTLAFRDEAYGTYASMTGNVYDLSRNVNAFENFGDSINRECNWDYTKNYFIRVYYVNGTQRINTTAGVCN